MKFLISEKLSQHKYKTPEGYLVCIDAILARTGKQSYRRSEVFADGDDEIIEIDRLPEEVFSAQTLASFENKPITVEHPDEDVNSENYKEYAVGFVRDVHRGVVDGQEVILGTLVITDAQTIEEIENGEHTDLSCGYDCDIVDEANPQQRNIRGNHVALCAEGRAGNARIVDSKKVKDIHVNRIAEYKNNMSKYETELKNLKQQYSEIDSKIYRTEQYLQSLLKETYRYGEAKSTNNKINNLKNEITKLENDKEELNKKIVVLESDLNDVKQIKDEISLTNGQIQDLKTYAKRYSYDWQEIMDGLNSRIKREHMTIFEAIEDIKESMVENKSLYDSKCKDANKDINHIKEYFRVWGYPSRSELQEVVDFYKLRKDEMQKIFGNHYNENDLAKLKYHDSIKDVSPREGETKEEFISRFMSETKEEYPDEKQRFAVANSYWEKKDMKDALNFDRIAECDFCGEKTDVAITHYGTSHYNRLVCKECAKELKIEDSSSCKDTYEIIVEKIPYKNNKYTVLQFTYDGDTRFIVVSNDNYHGEKIYKGGGEIEYSLESAKKTADYNANVFKDSKLDKPEFDALGKWEWDEEKQDWFDTGRKMYYNEIVRNSGGNLNDAKTKDAHPLVSEVAEIIKSIESIFDMRKALEQRGFKVEFYDGVLWAMKNGKKVMVVSKNRVDVGPDDIVQGNYAIGLNDSKMKDSKYEFDISQFDAEELENDASRYNLDSIRLGRIIRVEGSKENISKLLKEYNMEYEIKNIVDSQSCKDARWKTYGQLKNGDKIYFYGEKATVSNVQIVGKAKEGKYAGENVISFTATFDKDEPTSKFGQYQGGRYQGVESIQVEMQDSSCKDTYYVVACEEGDYWFDENGKPNTFEKAKRYMTYAEADYWRKSKGQGSVQKINDSVKDAVLTPADKQMIDDVISTVRIKTLANILDALNEQIPGFVGSYGQCVIEYINSKGIKDNKYHDSEYIGNAKIVKELPKIGEPHPFASNMYGKVEKIEKIKTQGNYTIYYVYYHKDGENNSPYFSYAIKDSKMYEIKWKSGKDSYKSTLSGKGLNDAINKFKDSLKSRGLKSGSIEITSIKFNDSIVELNSKLDKVIKKDLDGHMKAITLTKVTKDSKVKDASLSFNEVKSKLPNEFYAYQNKGNETIFIKKNDDSEIEPEDFNKLKSIFGNSIFTDIMWKYAYIR